MFGKKKPTLAETATWAMASKTGWAEFDPAYMAKMIWVPCPPFFKEGETRKSWAAESAQLWYESSQSPYGRNEVDFLASIFFAAHQDIYAAGHSHMAVLHLPDPRLVPLPVQLGIWAMEGSRDQTLRELAQADYPDAITPPITEEFTTERLGTGLKSTHHRLSRDRKKISEHVNYAWRSEQYETDLRLFAYWADLGRVERAKPDMDDLARAIEVIPAGGDGRWERG